MDPRQFAEEVDIVPKLPSGFQGALASSKWKERKEALDALAELLTTTTRIKDAPELSDVVKGLAGRMSDANVMCVMAAAVCLEHLAKGLMKSFARFKDVVVPPILERLKERKQNVTDALGGALDAVFTTVRTLSCVQDEFLTRSADKPPRYHGQHYARPFPQESSGKGGHDEISVAMSFHNNSPPIDRAGQTPI